MLEETKTITLRKKLVIGDETYEKIDLREPIAEELDKAQQALTPAAGVVVLVSLIARIPRAAAAKLCQRDLQEADNFFRSFSVDGVTNGDGQS